MQCINCGISDDCESTICENCGYEYEHSPSHRKHWAYKAHWANDWWEKARIYTEKLNNYKEAASVLKHGSASKFGDEKARMLSKAIEYYFRIKDIGSAFNYLCDFKYGYSCTTSGYKYIYEFLEELKNHNKLYEFVDSDGQVWEKMFKDERILSALLFLIKVVHNPGCLFHPMNSNYFVPMFESLNMSEKSKISEDLKRYVSQEDINSFLIEYKELRENPYYSKVKNILDDISQKLD